MAILVHMLHYDFFLNREQDISAFLLVDLGIVNYPTYNCINSEHIFPGLDDLLIYEETIENDADLGGQIQAIPT